MNVLSIFGGPRKKGNTATILNWVEEELEALGHQVERINLFSKKVKDCLACYKCKENPNEPGCIQKDERDANGPISRDWLYVLPREGYFNR